MVDISKVRAGMMNYAQRAVLPKIGGHRQFIAGMALGMVSESMEGILSALAQNPAVKAMKLIDGQMVDVDKLYRAAKEQFAKQRTMTVDVPMIGQLTFSGADLEELYQTICSA